MSTTEKAKPAGLIGSERVEGTPVFRLGGKRIGTIKRLILDKQRGTISYAPKVARNIWDFGDRAEETALLGYYGYPPY